MKESGVFGGSMLGITFFQASTKAESVVGAAGRSVERDRALVADRTGRDSRLVARRNIVKTTVGSLGSRKVGHGGGRGSLASVFFCGNEFPVSLGLVKMVFQFPHSGLGFCYGLNFWSLGLELGSLPNFFCTHMLSLKPLPMR